MLNRSSHCIIFIAIYKIVRNGIYCQAIGSRSRRRFQIFWGVARDSRLINTCNKKASIVKLKDSRKRKSNQEETIKKRETKKKKKP